MIDRMTKSFSLLQDEAFLFQSCICFGLTRLRKAIAYDKGEVYSGLLNLSVGIERLQKSIIVIEYMTKNSYKCPPKEYVADHKHGIISLHKKLSQISKDEINPIKDLESLNVTQKRILSLLNEFSTRSRYFNLDALSDSGNYQNPLKEWESILEMVVTEKLEKRDVKRTKERMNELADRMSEFSTFVRRGAGDELLTPRQIITRPILHEKALPYTIVEILDILMQYRRYLLEIENKMYHSGPSEMPHPVMTEFLTWIPLHAKDDLKKKRWP